MMRDTYLLTWEKIMKLPYINCNRRRCTGVRLTDGNIIIDIIIYNISFFSSMILHLFLIVDVVDSFFNV
jgi:hypothetical protein